jgi:hypothetical protein
LMGSRVSMSGGARVALDPCGRINSGDHSAQIRATIGTADLGLDR